MCRICHIVQAKKAAEAIANPPTRKVAALLDDSTDDTDPSLYHEHRLKYIAAKKAKGINPYPHKFSVSTSLPEYIKQYSGLEAGARLEGTLVSLAGACVHACMRACPMQCCRHAPSLPCTVDMAGRKGVIYRGRGCHV